MKRGLVLVSLVFLVLFMSVFVSAFSFTDFWNKITGKDVSCKPYVGQNCSLEAPCCPGLDCVNGQCKTCALEGASCVYYSDCCSGLTCSNNVCITSVSTPTCSSSGQSCTSILDCCSGLTCSNNICATQTCSDGTLHGQCSTTKPLYCNNGNLISKCSTCGGCPSGYSCQTNGNCVLIPTTSCTDICIGHCGSYQGCSCSTDCDIGKKCVNNICTTCASSGGTCISTTDCCSGLNCIDAQCSSCVLEGTSCTSNTNCCSGLSCVRNFCVILTLPCNSSGQSCTSVTDCCSGLDCINSKCDTCSYSGTSCTSNSDCCPELICSNNVCTMHLNKKSSSNYFDKSIFLISDENWKDVLSLVPITTWTEDSIIKKYPTLIYHSENAGSAIDIDSIIYFLQQYNPTKLIIVGQTPIEADNLLIANSPLGAGLQSSNILRISPNDYLNYWESFDTLVYVQDDYELSLLASTYASLINAPLIIKGTSFDTSTTFSRKNVICIGSVSPSGSSCKEQYTLNQLQQKYFSLTNTDKVILVNPTDLNLLNPTDLTGKSIGSFSPIKTANPIYQIHFRTSLLSPFLASAKKELIVSTGDTDYTEINTLIKSKISEINAKYLTIMGVMDVIPYREITATSGFIVYKSLDQTLYADIDNDNLPEIYTGRIMGISSSDVSSYVARDLFYEDLARTNKAKFMASSFDLMVNHANSWAEEFKSAGYDAVSVANLQDHYQFDPNEWTNQVMISYQDHGSINWDGIYSNSIPLLKSPIIFSLACLTCDVEGLAEIGLSYQNTFCLNALRQGTLGYIGTVSVSCGDQTIFLDLINNIYYSNLPLGEAFAKAFKSKADFCSQMTMLLGDPTLNVNPPYLLGEKLIW